MKKRKCPLITSFIYGSAARLTIIMQKRLFKEGREGRAELLAGRGAHAIIECRECYTR